MTRDEETLRDVLRGRIEHYETPATPMGDVVSTARRIRRGRQVRAGVVAAAAVAVLSTPFVVASLSGDTVQGPAGRSSEATLPTVLADVAAGPPPTVAWLDGRDYVDGDGTRTRLPFDDVARVVPYRGTLLLQRRGDGRIVRLDGDGTQWCGHGSLAVSRDGASAAFAVSPAASGCAPAGPGSEVTLHVGPTGPSSVADRTRPMPETDAAVVGILGDAVVVSPYNEGTPVLLGLDGTTTALDQLARVAGVDEQRGLVSGQLAGDPDDSPTGAVLDPATGSVLWTVTGWQLRTFSPDGATVLGLRPTGSGSALTWGVFDASSGEQLRELTTPAGFAFSQVVWEDDEHLLMDTTQGNTQAIVRVGTDGEIELATEPSTFDEAARDLRYALAPNAFA